jgi:CheY-like chemotaxis protein
MAHVANHGIEALDKLGQSKWANADHELSIQVVLMDQEMPAMSGIVCTKCIRQRESEGKFSGHIPVIGVTANARSEQIEGLLDAGMVSTVLLTTIKYFLLLLLFQIVISLLVSFLPGSRG